MHTIWILNIVLSSFIILGVIVVVVRNFYSKEKLFYFLMLALIFIGISSAFVAVGLQAQANSDLANM